MARLLETSQLLPLLPKMAILTSKSSQKHRTCTLDTRSLVMREPASLKCQGIRGLGQSHEIRAKRAKDFSVLSKVFQCFLPLTCFSTYHKVRKSEKCVLLSSERSGFGADYHRAIFGCSLQMLSPSFIANYPIYKRSICVIQTHWNVTKSVIFQDELNGFSGPKSQVGPRTNVSAMSDFFRRKLKRIPDNQTHQTPNREWSAVTSKVTIQRAFQVIFHENV